MSKYGTDLLATAKRLGTTRCKLAKRLIGEGIIRKTRFGYEATAWAKQQGLARTHQGQYTATIEGGQEMLRWYTKVLITPTGMAWICNHQYKETHHVHTAR